MILSVVWRGVVYGIQMRIYKLSTDSEASGRVFYHGTDSPPFDEFDPSKAVKGVRHYNPLGDALYVTDKRDFANMFGKNVYEVKIPSDAKLKRILPSKACSVIWDIIRRALVKVGIDYGNSDLMFKVDLHRQLDKARYSPYDAIMEASALVGLAFPEKAGEYYDWVSKIATQKFSKYDVVVFAGTNNPNDIFEGESGTREILVFNKAFQKVFPGIEKG